MTFHSWGSTHPHNHSISISTPVHACQVPWPLLAAQHPCRLSSMPSTLAAADARVEMEIVDLWMNATGLLVWATESGAIRHRGCGSPCSCGQAKEVE
ncbi:hypothetical protein SORBI_3002G419900 [Sorghum bicolor]|uniref:Uncharacterized protein n=1 Tax=Sorghum bicolor TaxID=4558 RepID=A0A1B6QGB7_SORBI|nr:hypothetical protein SORBI_3002G419900 [Sorghum bicolor]